MSEKDDFWKEVEKEEKEILKEDWEFYESMKAYKLLSRPGLIRFYESMRDEKDKEIENLKEELHRAFEGWE